MDYTDSAGSSSDKSKQLHAEQELQPVEPEFSGEPESLLRLDDILSGKVKVSKSGRLKQ